MFRNEQAHTIRMGKFKRSDSKKVMEAQQLVDQYLLNDNYNSYLAWISTLIFAATCTLTSILKTKSANTFSARSGKVTIQSTGRRRKFTLESLPLFIRNATISF